MTATRINVHIDPKAHSDLLERFYSALIRGDREALTVKLDKAHGRLYGVVVGFGPPQRPSRHDGPFELTVALYEPNYETAQWGSKEVRLYSPAYTPKEYTDLEGVLS